MRCGPIALYGYNMEESKMVELTRDCARITHSNPLGFNGAILQCLAIHQALHTHALPKNTVDFNGFLNVLIEKMAKIEAHTESTGNGKVAQNSSSSSGGGGSNDHKAITPPNSSSGTPFTDKLKKVKDILNQEAKGINYSVERLVTALGNDVSALKSVPTAIYAALKGQFHIDGFDCGSPFVRTLYYAISLGGDTDTIASMACTISGAIYGIEAIPKILLKHCESNDVMEKYADDLFRLVRSQI